MKIVIDTNIIVSSFIFEGTVRGQFIDLLTNEQIEILISLEIKDELRKTLFREKFTKYQAKETIEMQLDRFILSAKEIPIERNFNVCSDPKDNCFLNLAFSGKADFIITGDKDLLILDPFHQTRIVTISDFLKNHLPAVS